MRYGVTIGLFSIITLVSCRIIFRRIDGFGNSDKLFDYLVICV